MHMHMPGTHGRHHGHIMRKKMAWAGALALFWVVAVALAVLAMTKSACAALITARLKALRKVPDAFTEEERALLEHKIASSALRGF